VTFAGERWKASQWQPIHRKFRRTSEQCIRRASDRGVRQRAPGMLGITCYTRDSLAACVQRRPPGPHGPESHAPLAVRLRRTSPGCREQPGAPNTRLYSSPAPARRTALMNAAQARNPASAGQSASRGRSCSIAQSLLSAALRSCAHAAPLWVPRRHQAVQLTLRLHQCLPD